MTSFPYRLVLHAMDLDDDGHDVGVAGAWKQPVRAAATGNVALATALENGDSLDGLTLAGDDRVLLAYQTDASENGIYQVSDTGAPNRVTDFNTGNILGAFVPVVDGTVNGGKVFRVTNLTEPVVDTDDIDFEVFAGSGIAASLIDAKGDLIVGTAADTPGILSAPFFDGSALIRDAAQSTGLAWQSNRVTTTAPTVTDDGSGGWRVGSRWVNTTTDVEYVLVDATTGAAVWLATTGSGSTITTKDEGSTLSATVTTLDFTGAGVTASGSGATTTVNIPGGSGSDLFQTASGFGNVRLPGLGLMYRVGSGSIWDSFDTTDTSDPIGSWTTLGTPTAHDSNSTARSHYYIRKASASGVGLVGIYKSLSMADGDWVACLLSDHDTHQGGNIAGIFVGESGGTGKILVFAQTNNYSSANDRRLVIYRYTDRTTFSTEHQNTPSNIDPPIVLAIQRVSSTDFRMYFSRSGVIYNLMNTSAIDPTFTVGIAGLLIDTNGTGNDPKAIFDWIDNGSGSLA